ncbi:hypothetical protein [Dorea formicigenerans]|jgi:hypothetical protein|uniref:Uncharacterized protein n=1 Tax=Dorea formicigenerans TaxID=39486 RepID=A0A3E5GW77_9FIRM|nr:hypothetical protein [Dorea formicigenerans]RGO54819.1 hypothetical protein DXB12_00545 [Dorea formicigenerans]
MTLEQYMREIWLMNKQYGQEEELYPLINMLLRDGANTEKLSIRDVHNAKRFCENNLRKYINGFGGYPDLAIWNEQFGEKEDEKVILNRIYGCVEVKCNIKNPKQVEGEVKVKIELEQPEQKKNSEQDEVKIVAENKSEQPKQENYFIKRNNTKIYLHYADTGNATVEGQFLGELLWYGKVLYTDGLTWKYYKLSEPFLKENSDIRNKWLDEEKKNELPKGSKEYKTWIFKQTSGNILKIISKDIGDLTEIYKKIEDNKIKDKTSIPTFDSQDYDKWKNFKTNLATIDWTEDIFLCNRSQ